MSAYSTPPEGRVTWTTLDGRMIPIRWMQTQHLCHAFNKLCRDNKFDQLSVDIRMKASMRRDAFYFIHNELVSRGVLNWPSPVTHGGANQIAVSPIRETPAQLCMLRALIDTRAAWPGILDFHSALSCIWHQYDSAIHSLQSHADRGDAHAQTILTRFIEYRLDYPG